MDQWSSGRAVECDCPESSRGASPRRFESSLLREPRMKIVPMRGDYRGLAGVPLNRKHWHGWWAVRQRRSPAKTVGAEVPGEFDSRTIRQPICSDRPRDRAWNPAGRKRVGSAWRNAVGHTCPMRSRAFLLGVTAAHGSLEPLVLVRIQEEELGGSTSNRFSLYTRFDVCCTGYRGFRRHPSRETMPRPCSSVDRASASGAEGHESDSR